MNNEKPPGTYSVGVIAKVLGLSVRRVQQFVVAGVIPRGARNSYPLIGAVQGLLQHWRDRAEERNGGELPLDRARREKLELEAELKRMEVANLRGEFLPIGEAEALVREALEPVNRALKDVPRTHARELAKRAGINVFEAKRILDEVIEEVRAELRELD